MNCHKRSLQLFLTFPSYRTLPQRSVKTLSTSTLAAATKKERIVVLGVGWGGFRLAKDLDKDKFEVVVVSPRNHFLFTPLLPSTTVGTLEFGCIQEPVRTIKGITYHQSRAENIDFEKKLIRCRDIHLHHEKHVVRFDLPYDKLIIAVGTKSATFGIPGIESQAEAKAVTETGTKRHNVMFLKQLRHARAIRNRILECFERASNPHVTEFERKRLLTFVVVGGGPTSVEFTSELYDFLKNDVSKWYTDLKDDIRVVVIERGKSLLSSFDIKLQQYAHKKFTQSRNIEVMTEVAVKEVQGYSVFLQVDKEDGPTTIELPFGLCVWSIGNAPLDFVQGLNLSSYESGPNKGRIKIDNHLRIKDESIPFHRDVFAIGDCAADIDKPLGLLAQVANQQGKHLSNCLNRGIHTPFRYTFLGSMAQLGTFDAVVEGPQRSYGKAKLKGFAAFLTWRSAYWVKSMSITNKFLIPMFWFKTFFFGRDISKF